jgi:hypothetical protein
LTLLYHAPALAFAIILFSLFLAAASSLLTEGSSSKAYAIDKRLLIFGFPILATTHWLLLLPFLLGALFRKRGAWIVCFGLILTMIVGLGLGQTAVGPYLGMGTNPTQRLVLGQQRPAEWRSLGWLLDMERVATALDWLIQLGNDFVEAFLNTPLPLVQLVLWSAATWLVGWVLEQGDVRVSVIGLLLIVAGLSLSYAWLLPDLLELSLPFTPGAGTFIRFLLGAILVFAGLYGWPRGVTYWDKVDPMSHARTYVSDLRKEWLGGKGS